MNRGEDTMPNYDEPLGDDSVDAITDVLLTASRLLVAVSAQSIANVDETLTIPQFRTLVNLSTRGPVNLATLAGLLDVAPSTTGRMADRLVAAGFIDRQPHPDSRRELVVALTARGLDLVAAVTGHRRRRIAAVVHAMAPRERRGFVRALTAFTTAGAESPAALEIDGFLA
jgi:DNA-binding MarR family transcriptional regulator